MGQVYYTGQRLPTGENRVLRIHDQDAIDLDPCFDLRKHSPTGFEWGYAGSGPGQLALAILVDYLGNDSAALALYQRFKRETIAKIESDSWVITSSQLKKFVRDNYMEDLFDAQV